MGTLTTQNIGLLCVYFYIALVQLGEAIASFNFSICAYIKCYWFSANFYLKGSCFKHIIF